MFTRVLLLMFVVVVVVVLTLNKNQLKHAQENTQIIYFRSVKCYKTLLSFNFSYKNATFVLTNVQKPS